MLDVKCILVIGPCGARTDFISGWLGILPRFVDSNWHIKPVTGQSRTNTNFSKYLDFKPDSTLRSELQNYNFNLTPTADLYIALPCHGTYWWRQVDTNDLESSAVKIININVQEKDRHTVLWEYVCKTFLTDLKDDSSIRFTEEYLDSITEKFKPEKTKTKAIQPAILIDYDKLFVPGGSYYLLSKLNMPDVSKEYHDYYDTMLKLAITPDEFNMHGRLWRKQDYPYL